MSPDNLAIHVSNLSKKYTIGGPQERYLTFRDAIVNSVKAPFKRLSSHEPPQEFWALKDVSFDVEQGEVVGIIGRNGAGKSTLLKILSRITSPTEGTVDLYGRVGSLLEVGTGFHPELTGRENIYLSGSILGMKKREIEDKLDEIVKFSEIEKFLDTPAKRYSSGMYVRLAFAVAAHMDTEILLIDEVLAVGDALFQKKCLGKMGDVAAKEGRTVLFVSHNMGAVQSLCEKCLLISQGSVIEYGPSIEVISKYLNNFNDLQGIHNFPHRNRLKFMITRISLLKGKEICTQFLNSESLVVQIKYCINEEITGAQIAIELFSENGICILSSTSQDYNGLKNRVQPGNYSVECPIDLSLLRKGRYSIKVSSSVPAVEVLDIVENTLVFEVLNDPNFILELGQGRQGIIMPLIQWRNL
jgi:lipopolysaccharide transport system ATP-binding protein